MVTYSQDKKYAYFNNLKFCKDEKTGYYLNSTMHKRLHRYVYEYVNGKIPEGLQIHHKDHDKGNNEPENLELLTKRQHVKRHSDEMSDELRDKLRKNMIDKAIPAASEWHGTEAGHEWHKKHYESMKDRLYQKKTFVCLNCGDEFISMNQGKNKFCSNKCQSAYRRKIGIDNEIRKCVICGKEFEVNRYADTVCCSRSCANHLRWKNSKKNIGE